MTGCRGATRADPGVYLTPREHAVMTWAAEGKSCVDTAKILGISANTVRFHRTRAAAKVDACNMTKAVAECIRRKLIA